MSRLFWFIIGILGFGLIALLVSGDRGTVLGIASGSFAQAVALGAWGILIAAGIFGGGLRLGDIARQLSIWLIIILVLMSAYVFRFDLQDFASRLSGGLVPGSPISKMSDDGRETVTLIRAPNGHFEARAQVNNATIRFLIDTGASSIVLAHDDAVAAGIDPNQLVYSYPVMTANGAAQSARARIGLLQLGSITRRNVNVLVTKPGLLDTSLLGQSFLESLSSYEKRGDRLTLRD